ncbi:hypothetical protein CUMW_066220 [Citrus unshiu]|nr:hypothetical protein CUMW_066220 [Citrus unshiu]
MKRRILHCTARGIPEYPYSANNCGKTPLHMAAEYEHFSHKMLALLENCTSMSHEGPYGRTVLRAAVMQLDFRELYMIRKTRTNYHTVNRQNVSFRHILKYGYPILSSRGKKLSKDVGRGQYPDGAIFMMTVPNCYDQIQMQWHVG